MISQECFRAIEGRLYHYDDMKYQVACFQNDQWRLRAGHATGMPRGQALRSDPTAQGALALADPPPEIARCIQWIQCIEKALERIAQDSPLLDRLVRAYYLNNGAITAQPISAPAWIWNARSSTNTGAGLCRQSICRPYTTT